MAKKIEYRQCTLRKKESESVSKEMVTYIPRKFARRNKVLRLQHADNTWEEGWIVVQVGESVVLDDDLPDPRKAAKSHRLATGDALPRSSRWRT